MKSVLKMIRQSLVVAQTFDAERGIASICSFWGVVLNMMFGEARNANAREKENSKAFHFKGPTYTEVLSIEGLQPEPEYELQRKQQDMVQKLKMLKEAVENQRPDEVTSSWKLQVEQLYREVVLRSKQVQELPSNIHLERKYFVYKSMVRLALLRNQTTIGISMSPTL